MGSPKVKTFVEQKFILQKQAHFSANQDFSDFYVKFSIFHGSFENFIIFQFSLRTGIFYDGPAGTDTIQIVHI